MMVKNSEVYELGPDYRKAMDKIYSYPVPKTDLRNLIRGILKTTYISHSEMKLIRAMYSIDTKKYFSDLAISWGEMTIREMIRKKMIVPVKEKPKEIISDQAKLL